MHTHIWGLIVALLFILASVQAQDEPIVIGIEALCGEDALSIQPVDAARDDQTTQALDRLLLAMVTAPATNDAELSQIGPKAPGAVVLVDLPAERYFRAVGVTDVATCVPLEPTMPFAIGSNTKMFTTAVIYQLQEEGRLSTTDAVSKYLPQQMALFPRSAKATIDHLLTHTAGLPDYLNSINPDSMAMEIQNPTSNLLGTAFTPDELISRAAALQDDPDQPQFAPGEPRQWQYSNTGFIMLGMIIEQITGQSYGDAVSERILQPLEMTDTVLVEGIAPSELGLPSGYLKSPFDYNTSGWNYSQAWSAGNIVSTAEDMAVFVRAYYSGALFQQAETLPAVLTRAAAGAFLQSDDYYYMHGGFYKYGFLGHGGQTLGFESDIGYNPTHDTVIVIWTNAAESAASQGVIAVGHALGLTPSVPEFYESFFPSVDAGTESTETPSAAALSLTDVIGTPLRLSSYYAAGEQQFVQVRDDFTFTIEFSEDGSAAIVADCNRITADYEVGEAGSLNINLGASTMMACPNGETADIILALLADAARVNVTESDGVTTTLILTEGGSSVAFTTES